MPGKGRRKRKRVRKQINDWLERIGAYRVLGIAVWRWLVILSFLSCIGGYAFLMIRESRNPPTSETFVAEASGMWVEEYQSESGGYTVHRIRIRQDDEDFVCSVPSEIVQLWYRLETGKSYEFSITRQRGHCYVQEATEIDELQSLGIGK